MRLYISLVLELRGSLLSIQTGLSLDNAAVVYSGEYLRLGTLISYNRAQVLEACDCLKLLSIHLDLCADSNTYVCLYSTLALWVCVCILAVTCASVFLCFVWLFVWLFVRLFVFAATSLWSVYSVINNIFNIQSHITRNKNKIQMRKAEGSNNCTFIVVFVCDREGMSGPKMDYISITGEYESAALCFRLQVVGHVQMYFCALNMQCHSGFVFLL